MITDVILENIIADGTGSADDIFAELEKHEEMVDENKDLYDAMSVIQRVQDEFPEIQTLAYNMDVNRGEINMDGVCKHLVKANGQDVQLGDQTTDNSDVDTIINKFVDQLKGVIPSGLGVDFDILDDHIPAMDKRRFKIIISRK